jgi:hypothetical protein
MGTDEAGSFAVVLKIVLLGTAVYLDAASYDLLSTQLVTLFPVCHHILLAQTRHRRDKCGSLSFPFYLSILAVIKNEGLYLPEWIEYHLLVGVEHFRLVLNNNEDNSTDVLKPYISMGVVVLISWKGENQQRPIYNHHIRMMKSQSCWVAIIDADEFLVPVETHSVPEILRRYESFPGVAIHWVIFGTNGKKKRESGLVIERFAVHTEWSLRRNCHTKTIVNPRMVRKCMIHSHLYVNWRRAVNVRRMPVNDDCPGNGPVHEILWINHYWAKSEEELRLKRLRGDAVLFRPGLIEKYLSQIQEDIKSRPDVVANATGVEWAIPLVKWNLAMR